MCLRDLKIFGNRRNWVNFKYLFGNDFSKSKNDLNNSGKLKFGCDF